MIDAHRTYVAKLLEEGDSKQASLRVVCIYPEAKGTMIGRLLAVLRKLVFYDFDARGFSGSLM